MDQRFDERLVVYPHPCSLGLDALDVLAVHADRHHTGFVFQLIIMIKQERAVAYKRLVAKFYNKMFLNCVNLMRYYKVIPKILLITSLIASHSFAISLNTPLIQTNVFRESMETNVDTSKAAPDNA